MAFDLPALRAAFPSLRSGIAHFDGPGGTQTPAVVGEAIAAALTGPLSNRGAGALSERNADDAVLGFRAAMADLLGADPRGIVYGRSSTQLIYDASRALAETWLPGDEVVVTRLDHDANIRPWVAAAETAGANLRWIDFDPETAELSLDSLREVLSERTRLVAVTAASNLLGTRPPVAQVAALAHRVGALVAVDGVHYTAHATVDVHELGADLFFCSPYKFLGPHCGVLAAAPELLETLHPDKLLPSSESVPERFELGTLPYEIMAGVTAAVDFLASLGLDAGRGEQSRRERLELAYERLEENETALRGRIEAGLGALGATIYSRASSRTPTLLFTLEGRAPAEICSFLVERNVLAPNGSFYAIEAANRLGLGEAGGVRVGLAPYSDDSDVDRLLAALNELVRS